VHRYAAAAAAAPPLVAAVLGLTPNSQGTSVRPCDPELILHIPFVSDVKVRGVMVIGGRAEPNFFQAFCV